MPAFSVELFQEQRTREAEGDSVNLDSEGLFFEGQPDLRPQACLQVPSDLEDTGSSQLLRTGGTVYHSRSLCQQAGASVAATNEKEQQQKCIFSEFQAYRRWKEELASARAPLNLAWDQTFAITGASSTASARHVISEVPLNCDLDLEEEEALESLELGKFCGYTEADD